MRCVWKAYVLSNHSVWRIDGLSCIVRHQYLISLIRILTTLLSYWDIMRVYILRFEVFLECAYYWRHTSYTIGKLWFETVNNIQTFLLTYTYLDKELLHMVAIQLEGQNKWHLHLKAVGWYTHDFSVGSLSHMSQNTPPTLSTLSILRQLELRSINKRVYRQLFNW